MSLARTLMNGGYTGASTMINPAKYTADCGAHAIALESIQELHEIFLEEYNYEQADLAAISDGVALESSQYQVVAEASIKGIFTKVKEFFQKLWAKVKEFFHNIIRFFDSLFKSGKEFVTKYKKDIDNLDKVDGLVMSIHTYNDSEIDKYASNESSLSDLTELTNEVKTVITTIKGKTQVPSDSTGEGENYTNLVKDRTEKFKEEYDSDNYISKKTSGKCTTIAEYSQSMREKMMNGDTNASEETITVNMVKNMVSVLSKSKDQFKSLQTKCDKAYSDMLKVITDAEKEFTDKIVYKNVTPYVTSMFSAASSYFSVAQNMKNAEISVAKELYKKRDAEYKHIIVTALNKGTKKK